MKRTLESINTKILAAYNKRRPEIKASCGDELPTLIAVSKLKPIASIVEAYECGQRHFGENYLQELLEKSNSSEIQQRCPEIKFHFIGHLQSNKANKLPKIKNLHMIQTIDSLKLANLINNAFEKQTKGIKNSDSEHEDDGHPSSINQSSNFDEPVKVMIQINTSGEEQKSGVEPDNAPELADHIRSNCSRLELIGLMTIGKYEGWGDQENLDFKRLYETREKVANKLSIPSRDLRLSMGMSGDFEEAVTAGSSLVRVGTLIFGERN